MKPNDMDRRRIGIAHIEHELAHSGKIQQQRCVSGVALRGARHGMAKRLHKAIETSLIRFTRAAAHRVQNQRAGNCLQRFPLCERVIIMTGERGAVGFREIVRQHAQFSFKELVILAHQEVIELLLDEESSSIAELEALTGKSIRLQAESLYAQDQFDVVLV